MTKQRGFTLLELVAAMAIFALLSVMAYGGLNALIRSEESLERSYQRLQSWQMAVQRLRQDLSQARSRPVRDQFGDLQPAFYEPEDGRVEFTHGGRPNPLGLPRSSLERVAYFLDTDGRLMRLSWRNLDRGQSDEPLRLPLLEDIESLGWRFLDEGGEWREDWPPPSAAALAPDMQPLPDAVELLIASQWLGEVRLLFTTRADL